MWQPISEAPVGDEDNGPFFDVMWADEMHRYLPVPRREIDCYRRGNSIARQHGYPSMTTIFTRKPTHFMIAPPPPTEEQP